MRQQVHEIIYSGVDFALKHVLVVGDILSILAILWDIGRRKLSLLPLY
jgi:hypothetical protein